MLADVLEPPERPGYEVDFLTLDTRPPLAGNLQPVKHHLRLDRTAPQSLNHAVRKPYRCMDVRHAPPLPLDDPVHPDEPTTTLATFPFSLNPTATPDVQLVYGTTVIDSVTWTTSTTGKSLSLDPDFLTSAGNDSPTAFCDGVANYEATGPNQGTPGMANPQCANVAPPGMCDMGGGVYRNIVKPMPGALVITEFLANPAGSPDDDKEWFEVTNTSAASFDLNELGVANGAATPTIVPLQLSACAPIAPNGFALIARSNEPLKNAGLPAVDATFNFTLTDSGVNAGIQMFDGTTLLDAVKWTSVSSGNALQLDPDHLNVTDNDTAAVTAGVYCLGTTPYGDLANKGTPRAANAQCP